MKRTRKVKSKGNTVLACDPSLTGWGWAVINWDGTVVDTGMIKTEPLHKKQRIRVGDDFARRIKEIVHVLFTNIVKHKINYMVCELPHGSQNAAAAKMVGAVPSIMETMAITLDIGLEWYSEADGKKAVLGSTKGSKDEMVYAIKKLFPDVYFKEVGAKAINEAVADALACYYVGMLQSNTMKMLKKSFE